MRVAAAIVTYNRKDMLVRCIENLRNQKFKLNSILVVNNSSNDGTSEWLSLQSDLEVINQENLGSSGGQFTAVKYFANSNIDWLWVMDDDILAEIDCLDELVKVCTLNPGASAVIPVRYVNDKMVNFEAKEINFDVFFRGFNKKFISDLDLKKDFFTVKTMPFEGPLININAIKQIGFPDPEFFIIADDTDYSIRLSRFGDILMVSRAKMNRLINESVTSYNWKLYYHLRNLIYLDRTYGKNFLVKNLRPILTAIPFFKLLIKDFTIKRFVYFLRSIIHGYNNIRGKTVLPGEF